MSTLTAKVNFDGNTQVDLLLRDIIGTDIQVDWGDESQVETFPDGVGVATHLYSDNHLNDYEYDIIITGNITGLGNSAFRSLYYKEVNLPEGITSIGNYCFRDSGVEKLTIPETVTTIGFEFNYNNSRLKELIIKGNNLITIDSDFCFGASALEKLQLADSIRNIGIRAFSLCSSLKEFIVPKNLTGFSMYFLQNSQVDFIKFKSSTPIGLPTGANALAENAIIEVPRGALQTYMNTNGFPSDINRYKVYGDNIAEKIVIIGETMADNLTRQGIDSSANEGLTSLANKILDIGDSINKTLTYQLNYRDRTSTLRASQFSALLLANDEVIGGCLLPQDNNVTTQSANIFAYKTIVPAYDINNNEIDYTWKPLNDNINYDMENIVSSNNTHTTTLRQIWFADPCSHTPNLSSYNNANVISLVGGCTSGTIKYDNTEQAYRLDRTGSSRNNTWYIMFPITALHGKHGVIIEADIKSKHVAYNRIGFGCTDNERYIISNIGHDTWSSALRFSYGNIGNVSESGANYSFPDNDAIWYHCKFIADNDNYRCEIYDIDQTSLLVSLEQTYELLNEERIYGIAIGCPTTSTTYVRNIKCLHI